MKPSEILDNAVNIILRDGWTQKSYYDEVEYDFDLTEDENAEASIEANKTAPCCQDGALSRAAFGLAWPGGEAWARQRPLVQDYEGTREARLRAIDFMRTAIWNTDPGYRALPTRSYISPVGWNDEPGRTKDEVVAMLRAAAALAREAGE